MPPNPSEKCLSIDPSPYFPTRGSEQSYISQKAMLEKVDSTIPTSCEVEESGVNVVFQQIDPEEERKVVRKLDRVILPLMAFVYFFQCMCFCIPKNLLLLLPKASLQFSRAAFLIIIPQISISNPLTMRPSLAFSTT